MDVTPYTLVSDVEAMVATKLNLIAVASFGLFECGAANVERLLDPKASQLNCVQCSNTHSHCSLHTPSMRMHA